MKRLFFLLLIAFASFLSISASTNVKTDTQLTDDEIKAEIARASEYQSYLTNLFTDLSCSKLKDGITTESLPTNESYNKLSDPLKKMVNKIASGDWNEDYSDLNLKETYPLLDEVEWDSDYARKYRVQDYEPYSESIASELVGVSRYTNMNNPTGIVGDKGDLIYIMVKDAAPQGATLYINEVWNAREMFNNATAGTQLKQGLNIIECKNDNSHFFIYYCVQTVKQSNGKYIADETHNLKNYKPITIHIEGGRLNGFFNYFGDARYAGDTQKDFEYTVKRATHPMYNLIGKNVILHFHLEDTAAEGASAPSPCVKTVLFRDKGKYADREYDPVKILTAWDEMCLTERILMGIQSDEDVENPYNLNLYESNSTPHNIVAGGQTYKASPGFQYNEYFNNKLFGMSRPDQGLFMSAGDWRTSYNVNTIEAVLTLFTKGDIWGPAHEYGHMNQRLINMAGTTEESNNIFSNVVVYYQGKNTSRSDFISNQYEIFKAGKPFLENGTWGTTRMFWQLWCYYHATGHNKKFYPRLFELLRNYPIVKTNRLQGKHNERYDKLQFAKMCCLAAEEDLTDFFTAWGFFVPMELYTFADYQIYDTYLTEEDLQAVKDEIAAFKFKKNEAIIFIDDRVNSKRESYNGFPIEKAGDFGGFDAFNSNRAPSGDFGYSVDINEVTIITDGDPGAGFIIRDKDGSLLGFSNSKTFTVNDDVAEKLRNGEAIMEAVGANNGKQTVTNLISDGSDEVKKEILKRIHDAASELLTYEDPTETKVGYLLVGKTAILKELVNEVDNALKAGGLTSDAITGYINRLTKEFNRLTTDEDAFIRLEADNLYMITNVIRNPNAALTYNNTSNTCVMATKPAKPGDPSAAKFQWNFVPAMDENAYYIQNWDNKAFLDKAANGTIGLQFSGGYKYNLISFRNKNSNIGQFILAPFDDLNLAIHIGGNGAVIGYTSEAGASKWYITKVVKAEDVDMSDNYRQLLENLIKQYKEYKEEIDPSGTNVGFLKPEAASVFDNYCQTISSTLNRSDLNEAKLESFYNSQLQIYKNLTQANSDQRIGIETGAAYVLQNIYTDNKYHSRLLFSDDTYVSTTSTTDSKGFASQWVFEESENPGLYVIRNMENGKYVSASMDTKKHLPLTTTTPGRYGLIGVSHYLGQFGVGLDGKEMNALGTAELEDPNQKGVLNRVALLTVLAGDESKWSLRRVHEREYVESRDRLKILMDKTTELLYLNDDYLDYGDAWWETYLLNDAVSGTSGIYNNPATTLEEYQDWIEKLEGNLAYADALMSEDEIVTIKSIGSANDGVDNNNSKGDGIIRNAFNISESIIFDGLIAIDELDDPENIIVDIQPVGTGLWVTSDAKDKDSLLRDYQEVFKKTAPGAALFEQLQSLECEFIDGFYTEVSGKLTQEKPDEDYSLVMHVPCSGLYKVTLRGKEGYAIFDANKKIPTFTVEIYPNLKGIFNKERGFNINGFTFVDSEDHDKTVYLPQEAIDEMDLSKCIIYIPGLYFADEFTAWLDSEYSAEIPVSLSERRAASVTTNTSSPKYWCLIDLSSFKEKKENSHSEKLNVSLSKNGATSNYTFNVEVGDNGNVSTRVEGVRMEEEETIYYNLQGVRVYNPGKGIYIRRTGNKVEKVVVN